jgi:hypothetical protein
MIHLLLVFCMWLLETFLYFLFFSFPEVKDEKTVNIC